MVFGIENSSSQIKIGVTGGYDVIDHAISSDILEVENREGYQIGASLEILPFNGFGVETGVLYGKKEYKVISDVDADMTNFDYIMIPLSLKLRLNIIDAIGIYGVGGGYGAVKLNGGDLKYAAEEFKSKRFGAGVNAGGGISLFQHLDIGIYFRYSLTEKFEDYSFKLKDITDARSKSWTVKATYYF